MKTQAILDNLLNRNERILRVPLEQWMAFTTKQITHDLATKFKKDITTELTDWELIEQQGVKTIKPAGLKIMQTSGNQAYKVLAVQGSFSVLNVKAVKAAEKFTAKLVKDVTAGTKEGIRTYIKAGVQQGKSMPKIARELRSSRIIGLTNNQTESIINYRRLLEDKDKYPKLKPADVDKKVQRYADKTHRRRMENIARTETARAQNIGYCQGLEELGVTEAEFRISLTDYCEECEALDEERYSVGEAGGIIPVHPRCRCAMLPVIDDKVIAEPLKEPPETLGAKVPPDIPGPSEFDFETASSSKQLNWEDKLTSLQLNSFDEYTAGQTARILDTQRRIAGGLSPRKLSTADKVFYQHAVQIESALDVAPGYNNHVWRGLQFKSVKDPRARSLSAKLSSNKPFKFDTTTSFTGSKDFAAMVNQWDRVDDANKVKVMVHMKKAPKRSAYMGNLSGVEDEAEVLASVRTRYKVVNRTETMVGKTRFLQYELDEVMMLKKVSKIEPVNPPKKLIHLKRFTYGKLDDGQAIKISQKLRTTYSNQLNSRNFGEMENAVLTYDATRYFAYIGKKMVGAIAYSYDELNEVIFINHIGTLNAPEGTGAELVRIVVRAAFSAGVGISFEATEESVPFWERLGFTATKEVSYVFETSYKRMVQIKQALGSVGRVKTKVGAV